MWNCSDELWSAGRGICSYLFLGAGQGSCQRQWARATLVVRGHCGQLSWALWATLVGIVKNWNHGWQTWQAAYLCSQWWGGGIHFFIFPKISFPFPEEKSWLMRNPRARGRRGGGSVGGVSRGGAPPVGQSQVLKIRDGILKTNYCTCGLCPNYLPPIWTTCTTFLNAKNVDLGHIQNDSLYKILLK